MKKLCNICKENKAHKSWKAYTCDDCLEEGFKWCPSCCTVQSIANFHKNGNTVRSFCKPCEVVRSMKSRKEPTVKQRERRNKSSAECKRRKYHGSERGRLTEINRCHERRASAGTLGISEWLTVVELFNNECAYCGNERNLTQDHVIPINKNGEHNYRNIVPACSSCNSSKSNRPLIEWYTSKHFYSKDRLNKILLHMRGDAQ